MLNDLRQQIRDDVKARVEEVAGRLDLISREEFEKTEALLQSALKRLDEAEKKIAQLDGSEKTVKTSAKKAAKKKTTKTSSKKSASKKSAAK
ncbi:MAG: accessory factor UbiK family protein [Pseudomonadota bacterium]